MSDDGRRGRRPRVELRTRLRTGLREAMRARDAATVAVLRSVLGTIDNAEAVTVTDRPKASAHGEYVANAAIGVGATEAERRELGEADVVAILRHEVDERRRAAQEYVAAGQPAAAESLEAEAAVLAGYLDPAE